ncbi:hypothetical protein SBOR_6178 [Sclerotinia borealis F-4128]|uniref:Uncharacterized protein n=1 Tax=Sclerotinia borealis (strain F-4128) TaxID=1432307 RepID=W9CC44_SCLBF|nr:hypothetical protein SBOR_6178 [Sclerotinia borealis F-4128]
MASHVESSLRTTMESRMENLSEEAKKAAIACGEAINSLKYRPFENYEICDDPANLVNASEDFLKIFVPSITTRPFPSRVNALRITSGSAIVPVKPGASVELVPVFIICGTASILDTKLNLGDFIHLTKDTPVEPAFCCLLLLAQ